MSEHLVLHSTTDVKKLDVKEWYRMLQYFGVYILISFAILFLFILLMERSCRKEEKQFFNFKCPLYYIDTDKGNDNVLTCWTYVLYVLLFSWAILVYINEKYPHIYSIFLTQINAIESIVISYFGIVVSVIIFSVTLGPKEYYLSRTRDEVNRQFQIHTVFQIMSLCAAISVICTFMLQKLKLSYDRDYLLFSLYEICCVGIILLGIYGLIIIGMLTLGRSRMELYSLNKLHIKLLNNSVLKLLNQTEDVIYVNLGYLIKRYVKLKYVRKDLLSQIGEIEYIQDMAKNRKWLSYAAKCLAVFLTIVSLISITFLIKERNYIWLVVTSVLLGIWLFGLYSQSMRNVLGECLVCFILSRAGFLIRNSKDLNDDKFAGLFSLISDRAGKNYIRSICNMMALYCIICSCWKRKKYQMIIDSYDDMIEYIKAFDKGKTGLSKAMLYLPVIVCGYYYHINFPKKKFPKSIIKLFDSFKLSQKEKQQYFVTVNSFISYASRFRPSHKDRENKKRGKWDEAYYVRYIENNGYSQLYDGLEL